MVRDWKWDYDVKHHITVNAELDLNTVSGAAQVINPGVLILQILVTILAAQGGRSQDHKNFCCLCCKLVSCPTRLSLY